MREIKPAPNRREHTGFPISLRPFNGNGLQDLASAMPSVDVIDRDDEVLVRAAVPGYKKEEKGDYYRCEISQGSFSRAIALPADVDESKAKASMKDGMLELTLPKLEKAKRRTISIS